MGEITFLVYCKDDVHALGRIYDMLCRLKPDVITIDNDDGCRDAFESASKSRDQLMTVINGLGYSPKQMELIDILTIKPYLLPDYQAALVYSNPKYSIYMEGHNALFEDGREIPVHLIDGYQSSVGLPNGKVLELTESAKVWMDLSYNTEISKIIESNPILVEFLNSLDSHDLASILKNLNEKVEEKYGRFNSYFHSGNLNDLGEEQLNLFEKCGLMGVIGPRDVYESRRLMELSKEYDNIVHIGGLIHMVDLPCDGAGMIGKVSDILHSCGIPHDTSNQTKTLYSILKEKGLEPKRVVANPKYFARKVC